MLDYIANIIGNIYYSKFYVQIFNLFWAFFQKIVQNRHNLNHISQNKVNIFNQQVHF